MSVSGVVTEGMLPLAGSLAQLMGGVSGGQKGVVMKPGALGVFTDASETGNWSWQLWYLPLVDGASVIAA